MLSVQVLLVVCLLFIFVSNADCNPTKSPVINDSQSRRFVSTAIVSNKKNGGLGKHRLLQVKKSGERPVVESRNKSNRKDLLPASKDVIIKGVLIEAKEPAVPTMAKPLPAYQSNVLCEAGKYSGWLHCEDITGETERSEAEQVCQAHNQTLWTYAQPRSSRSLSFWLCAKFKIVN